MHHPVWQLVKGGRREKFGLLDFSSRSQIQNNRKKRENKMCAEKVKTNQGGKNLQLHNNHKEREQNVECKIQVLSNCHVQKF